MEASGFRVWGSKGFKVLGFRVLRLQKWRLQVLGFRVQRF